MLTSKPLHKKSFAKNFYMASKKILLLFLLHAVLSFSCKKEKEIAGEDIDGKVSDSLAKAWVSYSDAYFGNAEISVYNPQTGIWFFGQSDPWALSPRPVEHGIKFTSDGGFEICKSTSSGTGGCRTYTFFFMQGTAVQEGNSVTLYPKVHRGKHHSVCNPSLDYDKNLDKSQSIKFTYGIVLKSGYNNTMWEELTIKWSDGTESIFYRQV